MQIPGVLAWRVGDNDNVSLFLTQFLWRHKRVSKASTNQRSKPDYKRDYGNVLEYHFFEA